MMNLIDKNKTPDGTPKLWTKDFIILIAGSFVSMAGAQAIIMVIGLLVLDMTDSAFYYSVILAIGNAMGIIVPLVVGMIANRFSINKMIYSLDFAQCIFLLLMALVYMLGFATGVTVLIYCALFSVIGNAYKVFYDAYFPIITKSEVREKAYSVSTFIEIISASSVIVGTFLYKQIGVVPVLIGSAVCYFVAAIFETRFHTKIAPKQDGETFIGGIKSIVSDNAYAAKYILSNKWIIGLLLISMFVIFCEGIVFAGALPYYKKEGYFSEYSYIIAMSFLSTGQTWGSLISYKFIPKSGRSFTRFSICSLIMPLCYAMFMVVSSIPSFVLLLLAGISETMAHSVRAAMISRKVPSQVYTQYVGFYRMLTSFASVCGNLLGGALFYKFSIVNVVFGAGMFALFACAVTFVIFGPSLSKAFSKGISDA